MLITTRIRDAITDNSITLWIALYGLDVCIAATFNDSGIAYVPFFFFFFFFFFLFLLLSRM